MAMSFLIENILKNDKNENNNSKTEKNEQRSSNENASSPTPRDKIEGRLQLLDGY